MQTNFKETAFVFAWMAMGISTHLAIANTPQFAGFEGADSYSKAENYCKTIGGHLPSARDMATYAVSLGAQGIKETAYPNLPVSAPSVKVEMAQMAQQGYQTIATGSYSHNVDFYYNAYGFKSSLPEKESMLWTSTSDYADTFLAGIYSIENQTKYTLANSDGSFGTDNANSGSDGVLCSLITAMPGANPPAPGEGTIALINPNQIQFSVSTLPRGSIPLLEASIENSEGKPIQSIALDSCDFPENQAGLLMVEKYCEQIVETAIADKKMLSIDFSYKKPAQFCTVSEQPIH